MSARSALLLPADEVTPIPGPLGRGETDRPGCMTGWPRSSSGCARYLVLDAGAGTGEASKAVERAGAQAIGLDRARGMLAVDRCSRPPSLTGDLVSLPVRDRAFDGVIAAFSLSHLADPAAGLREAARLTQRGGVVIASVFAMDDAHPVKRRGGGRADRPWLA